MRTRLVASAAYVELQNLQLLAAGRLGELQHQRHHQAGEPVGFSNALTSRPRSVTARTDGVFLAILFLSALLTMPVHGVGAGSLSKAHSMRGRFPFARFFRSCARYSLAFAQGCAALARTMLSGCQAAQ